MIGYNIKQFVIENPPSFNTQCKREVVVNFEPAVLEYCIPYHLRDGLTVIPSTTQHQGPVLRYWKAGGDPKDIVTIGCQKL